VDPRNVEMNDMEDATEETLKGYTNIALFGIDTREMGDLGAVSGDGPGLLAGGCGGSISG